MKIKEKPGICWGELRGTTAGTSPDSGFTYLYGSTLIYYAADHIFFENKLMASGQIIHEWSSVWNYQRDRLTPALPLLKKGQAYLLTREMDCFPAESVFLKLVFLNSYGEEVGRQVERGASLSFVYPPEAYSYKVQLLSAGVESFDFHFLRIQPVKEELHD